MSAARGKAEFSAFLLTLYFFLTLVALHSIEVLPFMKIGNLAYLPPSKGSLLYILLALAIYCLIDSLLSFSEILRGYIIIILAYLIANVSVDYIHPVNLEFFTFRGLPALNLKYLPIVTFSYIVLIVLIRRVPKPVALTVSLFCMVSCVTEWFKSFVTTVIKMVFTGLPSIALSVSSRFRGYEAVISIFVGIPLTILAIYIVGVLFARLMKYLKDRIGKNYIHSMA